MAIGQLPDTLLEQLESMKQRAIAEKNRERDRSEKQETNIKMDPYKIERMREYSRILEPQARIEAATFLVDRDELARELLGLSSLDKAELLKHLSGLLSGKGKWARPQGLEYHIVAAARLSLRLGETFAEAARNGRASCSAR